MDNDEEVKVLFVDRMNHRESAREKPDDPRQERRAMKLTLSEASETVNTVAARLDRLTRQKMAENGRLQYHDALKLVASENRDLDRSYTAAVRRLASDDEV